MIVLDAKTDFSFMRGFGNAEQWHERCQELGVKAFGIADYCSTWGHADFTTEFAHTKLLYGVQLPVCEAVDKNPKHGLVTLIAKHNLQPMYEAVSKAHEQTYYRPRLTWNQVRDLHEHCWVIINQATIGDNAWIKRIPGALIGLRPKHDAMLAYAQSGEYPCVPAFAPSYPSIDDRTAWSLMQAISTNARIGESEPSGVHMLRQSEFESAMRAVGFEPRYDLLDSIADEATAKLKRAPLLKVGGSLEQLVMDRAAVRGIDLTVPAYQKRLLYELDVVRAKQFEDYFIFVADIVWWAKERMLVGPGRGSSSGSLLAYALGITEVDPIKYGTMFERFIDTSRADLPDIDVDFPDYRRDEVFTYLRDKYGADRVARLGTLSCFGGKSALNDTAKATGVPLDVAREIGRYTEGAAGMVISPKWVFDNEEVAPLVEKWPAIRQAALIDGHPRHHGVHAAGVVVTNEPISNYGSVDKHGTLAMDMEGAERLGLIKMDVLGLRTLSVIEAACILANQDPTLIYRLDPTDPQVYDGVFNADHVTGVFQFEGQAVRSLMKQVKVDCFDDLCALTSLARPGPLSGGAAEKWLARRSGVVEWSTHETLKPHTQSTFGTIVYQEQAMSIVRDLGAFTDAEVNGFRRAVGKKDPEKLATYRTKFVEEAEKRMPGQAEDLWDEMCEFASYAFNFAHAVSYSLISYASAYIKQRWPLEFATAQLRHAADDEQAKALLRELKEEGYEYVPFDPALSMDTWSIINGKLYGGFDSIIGVGIKTAQALLKAREANPDHWLDRLTESQRDRLLRPNNTPWHTLSYFTNTYEALYKDPLGFKPSYAPLGFRPPILRIKDIPPVRGSYAFLGRIIRKWRKEKDGGAFWNLILQDDTGEIGATISRRASSAFSWLTGAVNEGKDYFIRGTIANDGRTWMFLDNIVELEKQ
jgi:DNA polymerase III alpha subunit